jgi:myosin I
VAWKHIKDREKLQGSIQQLLYGSADKQDDYRAIIEENKLRSKLEFIESVLTGWIQGGGLGCLHDARKYTWDGPQLEDSKRQDWVSIGRFGGDVD